MLACEVDTSSSNKLYFKYIMKWIEVVSTRN